MAAQVEAAVRDAAARAGFALDPAQEQALPRLAALVGGAPGGLYLWGPPGRGKTWLVDAALAVAPPAATRRAHLHDLYAGLHAAVGRGYAQEQVHGAWGRAVREVLAGVRLLVLDELQLHDSDDVWIAQRVLGEAWEQGGAVVVTSNTSIDDLHRHPLFAAHADGLRALLRARTLEVAFEGARDHRRAPGGGVDRPRFRSGALLTRGDGARLAALGLTPPAAPEVLQVGGRALPVAGTGDGVVWVGFRALCERPTAASDHAELAGRFPTWVVVGVPALRSCAPDALARFRAVVDVAHDRDVRLVLLTHQDAAATLSGPLALDLARTLSRLALLPGAAS